MKKPARAKASPAKPSPKAKQPGNAPGRGKAAHAKKAPAKPAHVPAKVKQARHAAAVKASKTRAANAKKAKAHPRRQLALGEGVACCYAEAVAASLRLSGRPVRDSDVLALHRLAGGSDDAGGPIVAALEAAYEFGLAGVRPVSFGPVDLDDPAALILGLKLPASHAVLDTGSEWITWGERWPAWAFPDAVTEEAWEVTWPAIR